MNFYHDLITEKSWRTLQDLSKQYNFILIGGWAVFLFTHALKSKDIDLVMEYQDLDKLRQELPVNKNDRLKKYEARTEEVEIDIYIPFYSNPGLPAEELRDFSVSLEGFEVVEKEALAILKEKALIARRASAKGRKDLIDLVSLFDLSDFNWEKYRSLVTQYRVEEYTKFTQNVLRQTMAIEEVGLNAHKMSRLKKRILPMLK